LSSIRCEACGIGHCRAIRAPYLIKVGHYMLVMPDSPAYVCDICGHRFFDGEFAHHVHNLLMMANDDSKRRAQRRQTPRPEPAATPHARRSR
jgi:hypothetical protein